MPVKISKFEPGYEYFWFHRLLADAVNADKALAAKLQEGLISTGRIVNGNSGPPHCSLGFDQIDPLPFYKASAGSCQKYLKLMLAHIKGLGADMNTCMHGVAVLDLTADKYK